MYYARSTSEEWFYLCLLLTTVMGATSFEDLRTFQDVQPALPGDSLMMTMSGISVFWMQARCRLAVSCATYL
jgi:hypothetical protein